MIKKNLQMLVDMFRFRHSVSLLQQFWDFSSGYSRIWTASFVQIEAPLPFSKLASAGEHHSCHKLHINILMLKVKEQPALTYLQHLIPMDRPTYWGLNGRNVYQFFPREGDVNCFQKMLGSKLKQRLNGWR